MHKKALEARGPPNTTTCCKAGEQTEMGAFTKAALRFYWVMKIEGYQEEVLEVWVFFIVDTKQILNFWGKKEIGACSKVPGTQSIVHQERSRSCLVMGALYYLAQAFL